MEVVPTAYLGPASYYKLLREGAQVEVMESYEKQTFRNRCLIQSRVESREPREAIRLTVPVKKSENKQLTRDVEVSYQTRWQHQHWMALVSSYEHTPFFQYYADYLRPWYEKETKWLVDLNDGLSSVILDLMDNQYPRAQRAIPHTTDWSGQTWTDRHPWQKERSILELLFEYGNETTLML